MRCPLQSCANVVSSLVYIGSPGATRLGSEYRMLSSPAAFTAAPVGGIVSSAFTYGAACAGVTWIVSGPRSSVSHVRTCTIEIGPGVGEGVDVGVGVGEGVAVGVGVGRGVAVGVGVGRGVAVGVGVGDGVAVGVGVGCGVGVGRGVA